jgi:hypothetical protein
MRIVLLGLLLSTSIFAEDATTNIEPFNLECDQFRQLNEQQCEVIQKLKNQGHPIIIKEFKVNESHKTLVVLGVQDTQTIEESKSEIELISLFQHRLLEGYVGTGDKRNGIYYDLYRRALKQSYNDEASERMGNGGISSLDNTAYDGFTLIIPTNDLLFNGCYLGTISKDGEFYGNNTLDQITRNNNQENLIDFFTHFKFSLDIYQSLKLEKNENKYIPADFQYPSCENIPKIDKAQYPINYFIENGKFSQWKDVCKHVHCSFDEFYMNSLLVKNTNRDKVANTFSKIEDRKDMDIDQVEGLEEKEGPSFTKMLVKIFGIYESLSQTVKNGNLSREEKLPGVREVIMADNIYKIFQNGVDVSILVSRGDHLGFFEYYFSKELKTNVSHQKSTLTQM